MYVYVQSPCNNLFARILRMHAASFTELPILICIRFHTKENLLHNYRLAGTFELHMVLSQTRSYPRPHYYIHEGIHLPLTLGRLTTEWILWLDIWSTIPVRYKIHNREKSDMAAADFRNQK